MTIDHGRVLLADADREQALTILRDACVDGRLTLEEFSERADTVLTAHTRADLTPAVADLAGVTAPIVHRPPAPMRTIAAIMGEAKRIGRWRLGARTTAIAVMGNCELDLRSAEISDGTIEIVVYVLMGAVKLVVPEGVEVELDGIAVMGSKQCHLASGRFVPGGPVVYVRAYALMGTVQVESRP